MGVRDHDFLAKGIRRLSRSNAQARLRAPRPYPERAAGFDPRIGGDDLSYFPPIEIPRKMECPFQIEFHGTFCRGKSFGYVVVMVGETAHLFCIADIFNGHLPFDIGGV